MSADLPPMNGDPAAVMTARVIAEMREGRVIAVDDNEPTKVSESSPSCQLIAAVENLNTTGYGRIINAMQSEIGLALTAERARALGFAEADGPGVLSIERDWTLARILSLAGAAPLSTNAPDLKWQQYRQDELAVIDAAIRLAKLARLLPALLVSHAKKPIDPSVMQLDKASFTTGAAATATNLLRISEAPVPLADAEDARVVVFRDEHTQAEHVAVICGTLAYTESIPVRIHSACLTGDLLASLRCDCGEQLRTAMRHISGSGGGVLLYLDQEGRGIGLANKLRAYGLQDQGLDTIDADQHLGFAADERSYSVAAGILRELGISRVKLLTNNPSKIENLRANDIEVTERIPLVVEANEHNATYLHTKRERAGHMN